MDKVIRVRSRAVKVLLDNIDTDQITPARFLITTKRGNFAHALFGNWRYDEQGRPKSDFVLNRPESQGRTILVGGDNFGCGSSREHAPWAVRDWGFRAVVSTTIADIFRNNCLKNGIVPVVVSPAFHQKLVASDEELTVDVESCTISLPDGTSERFPIDAFARTCLLNGVDELGYLLSHEPAIAEFERRRP
jgi:3-isopropylmalate/(R)-2-methylmalate dehydratase small subunit